MFKREADSDIFDSNTSSEEDIYVKKEEKLEASHIFPKEEYKPDDTIFKGVPLPSPTTAKCIKGVSYDRYPENRELGALTHFSKQLKHPEKKFKNQNTSEHDSVDINLSDITSLASSVSLKLQRSTVNLVKEAKARKGIRRVYDSGAWPVKKERIQWCTIGVEEDPTDSLLPVQCNQPSSFIPQIDLVSKGDRNLSASEPNAFDEESLQRRGVKLGEALSAKADGLSRDFRPFKDIEQHKSKIIGDEVARVGLMLNTCHYKRREKLRARGLNRSLVNLRGFLANAQTAGFSKEAIKNTKERLKAMGLLANRKDPPNEPNL